MTSPVAVGYGHGGVEFEGLLIGGPTADGPRPGVLVFPGWEGRTDGVVDVARVTADLGYAVMAAETDGEQLGATMHAFMVPTAADPSAGVQYNARSARRAWELFTRFLPECVGPQ